MSQNHEARMHGLQPPLPLVDPEVGTDGTVSSGTDAEWHLDEHTREVGRRGIAAARARLRSSPDGARRGRTGHGPADGTPGRAPGRAA